jgi:hypothetical protein
VLSAGPGQAQTDKTTAFRELIDMVFSRTPEAMPVLSQGKHRSPRKGACFMELASYLAGERWSDHPRCTHPLLAALARDVNDSVTDETRQRLAPMIPDVIGLNGDDPRLYPLIAREAALAALPVVSAQRQGVAAVAVLRCERVLNELEGRPVEALSTRSADALAATPDATRWARTFSQIGWGTAGTFNRRSAPAIVHHSVSGIGRACIEDNQSALVDLLGNTIERCRHWLGRTATEVPSDDWQKIVQMTHR